MLGPLEVHTGDGSRVQVRGARLRTLLILLALRPGRLVPATQLMEQVNLRHVLSNSFGFGGNNVSLAFSAS